MTGQDALGLKPVEAFVMCAWLAGAARLESETCGLELYSACFGQSQRILLRTMPQGLVVLDRRNQYRPVPDSS